MRGKDHQSQLGISLIEVMISLLVSTCMLSFLIELYLTSQQSYQLQVKIKQKQDSAQLAIAILKDEIRQAGYIGCPRLSNDFPLQSFNDYAVTEENKIVGNEMQIVVRHANRLHVQLENLSNDHTQLKTTKEVHFSQNDLLLISDCTHGEIFLAKDIKVNSAQWITSDKPLVYSYHESAEVSRFEMNTFYVSKNKLYLKDIHQRVSELMANLSWLRFSYTYSADGSSLIGVAMDSEAWHAYVSLRE